MKRSDNPRGLLGRVARAAAMVSAVCLSACSATKAPPAPITLPWPADAGLRAGVSEVDITPPLGLGLYGHGFEGRPAEGIRLRLRCQTFAFAQGAPSPEHLVLVTCDLAAPSLALQRLVVSRVRAQGIDLSASRVLLMATHTHAGPAHYFRSPYYAGAFGSSVPGFDDRVESFLADAISDGVIRAVRDLAPATVEWRSQLVSGLTRNRSLAPFRANHDEVNLWTEYCPSTGFLPSGCVDDPQGHPLVVPLSTDRSIDPLLSVLIVRGAPSAPGGRGRVRGVFAAFAMHPTAIANTNNMYHGDTFGYATRYAEQRVVELEGGAGGRVVVGIANGAEGDVSPTWQTQSPQESRRIGEDLGEAIFGAVERSEPTDRQPQQIEARYRDLHFQSALFYDAGRERRLCDTAELGAPAAGGAEDGPTRFRFIPEFNEGVRSTRDSGSCHGGRIPIYDVNTPGPDARNFPEVAPISLVRLGGRYIAALPGEPTTTTGYHIRQALAAALSPAPSPAQIVIVGLTNEYLQYFATSDEFERQHYEGASTLWGPDSERFLAEQFVCLARNLGAQRTACAHGQSEAIDAPTTAIIPAPSSTRLMPDDDVDPGDPFNARAPRVCRVQRIADGQHGVRVRWHGPAPAWVTRRDRLRVEIQDETGQMIDSDDGPNIEVGVVRDLGRPDEPALWEARWFRPEACLTVNPTCVPRGLRLHFAIRSLHDVASVPFTIGAAFPSANDRVVDDDLDCLPPPADAAPPAALPAARPAAPRTPYYEAVE